VLITFQPGAWLMYCLFAMSYAFLSEFSVEIPARRRKPPSGKLPELPYSRSCTRTDAKSTTNSKCRGLYHDSQITASNFAVEPRARFQKKYWDPESGLVMKFCN